MLEDNYKFYLNRRCPQFASTFCRSLYLFIVISGIQLSFDICYFWYLFIDWYCIDSESVVVFNLFIVWYSYIDNIWILNNTCYCLVCVIWYVVSVVVWYSFLASVIVWSLLLSGICYFLVSIHCLVCVLDPLPLDGQGWSGKTVKLISMFLQSVWGGRAGVSISSLWFYCTGE